MNRLQLSHAFWFKASELAHLHAFCYFWLFQQSWLICPLHWKDTCRSGRANLPVTGKLSVTHGAKTSDTNYQVHLELLCMLCVKCCPVRRFEYYLWLLQPTACLFWVTLKSVTACWHHPNPQTGRLEYCLALLRSNAGGTKMYFSEKAPTQDLGWVSFSW